MARAALPPAAGAAPAIDLATRAELAVRGIRSAPPVNRRAGAGPSDDGHWMVGGCATAVPVADDSPFAFDPGAGLLRDGVPVADVMMEPIDRPRFYDLTTEDGVPYEHFARLHGRDVLATTVVQTCVRYPEEETRCRFCTIEESLRAGATAAVKRPETLAEVAEAAVRLDGVRHAVMTTGTSRGADRGARYLARCVRAVRARVPGLPVQVQVEPPADLRWIDRLRAAGAEAIGIHVESLDQAVRERWTPGKAAVPLAGYEAAWRRAVAAFGPNRVSTYLMVGLGEDPDELVAGAERLIAMGVYPFVVPFRPLVGALAHADGVPAPDPSLLRAVTERVAAALRAAGMRGADQRAGCAACGACSALAGAGG